MDGYHPERPPRRAVNQPQKYQPLHSAGLLVDVVRTLTTSPSQAQKELQKEKLEKDYASTSEAINRLIDEHHDDLTLVLQSFRRLSTNVKTARERIRMVKNNLSSCQMLLRCKRDELKKLWLESAEHKYIVKLLEQLETVKSSYTELVEFIENKNYLHAAELLTVSQMTLDGNLKEMESLKDLRCMFDECRHALFEKILSEISEQLYNKPAVDVLNQVGRAAAAAAAGCGASAGNVSELSKVNDLPLGNTTIDYASIVNQRPVLSDNGCSFEDPKDEDRFNKPVQRLSTLVDALGWLDQLQEAVARIESQMDDRLWTVLVNGTTKFIRDHLHGSASATGDCRSLAELMRLLFVQFRATASVFQVLVKQMERVHQKFQLMACYQESVEYFAKITKAAVTSLPQSVRTKLKILPDTTNVDDYDHDHQHHHHQQQQQQQQQQQRRRIVDDHADDAQAELQSEAITEPSSLYGHFMHCLQSVDQLAANCLLMLHLEVRVHCFYHLLPLFQLTAFVGSNQQIDQQVIHLNKDLMQMHDALSGFFQPYKLKYIFDGLGHLIAAIFISACQNISRINDAGKKRICRDIYTIQQCLSNLTGEREADLDQARKFYQLLYKSPDDILNSVVENGPEFTLQQYSNLLALAVRSHATLSSEPGALEQRLTRLKNLTNEMRNLEKNQSSTHE
ncbi:Exocyst complex component 4 [Trichinella pseudospiralis]|uniref:Exocyst complex component Sec8 n=1 Tax=Trichinella pseudospiralis TaxID=6337 RepID=A0A0V0XXV1_TRIPS|nr:Exocyst complex component 4 [Trichinella pseudospiralis]